MNIRTIHAVAFTSATGGTFAIAQSTANTKEYITYNNTYHGYKIFTLSNVKTDSLHISSSWTYMISPPILDSVI